jgi:hypothetical protein
MMEMQTVKDKDAFVGEAYHVFVHFGIFMVQHVLHTDDAFPF